MGRSSTRRVRICLPRGRERLRKSVKSERRGALRYQIPAGPRKAQPWPSTSGNKITRLWRAYDLVDHLMSDLCVEPSQPVDGANARDTAAAAASWCGAPLGRLANVRARGSVRSALGGVPFGCAHRTSDVDLLRRGVRTAYSTMLWPTFTLHTCRLGFRPLVRPSRW